MVVWIFSFQFLRNNRPLDRWRENVGVNDGERKEEDEELV
jgi:hypothetical protein